MDSSSGFYVLVQYSFWFRGWKIQGLGEDISYYSLLEFQLIRFILIIESFMNYIILEEYSVIIFFKSV